MTHYDLLIRGGAVFDGTGAPATHADVAVAGDRIVAVGRSINAQARSVIDASGLAVAPGFINMMSWATDSLIYDGRSMSDLSQGVTFEVFGEVSMGPLNARMKQEMIDKQRDLVYDIEWSTLREYLAFLETRGISPNVGSFVGAGTVREYVMGYEDRPASERELEAMKALVRQAMEEGAFGIASALIYAPGSYSSTKELIDLSRVAAEYHGIYISHIRSETDRLLAAIDELITISEKAGLPAEIYHFKVAGHRNWQQLGDAVDRINTARARGLRITADMYTYTAGRSGLDAVMPPWTQEGGQRAWIERLRNPELRARIRTEMLSAKTDWENFYTASGGPDGILLVGFKSPELKRYTGLTLAEVARMRNAAPPDVAMDLVVEDESRISTVFSLMSEENVKEQIKLPWMSFCSDEASLAPVDVFLKSNPHPRGYGSFARLLGKYVRDEKVIDLSEAIRRLTSLPATNLRLKNRGRIAVGAFADIVVFDPAKVADKATYEQPHQLAIGVEHVFVNGTQVLKHGSHTGAFPGRAVFPEVGS